MRRKKQWEAANEFFPYSAKKKEAGFVVFQRKDQQELKAAMQTSKTISLRSFSLS